MRTTLKMFSSIANSNEFILRHKKKEHYFTRQRKLPFSSLLALVLRKSVKSLQLVLNEWCRHHDTSDTITASALSQARNKFSHTAFIELLDKCVVAPVYERKHYKRYRGHRLLAIDGSTLHLPTSKELIETFGAVEYRNEATLASLQVEAKVAVLYDVLNEIPLSGSLDKARTNDIKAAAAHLSCLQSGDLLMADRGYSSYSFFAEIQANNANYVIRLQNKTYQKYHSLLSSPKQKEAIAEIKRPYKLKKATHLPESLTIRFIRVCLPDGEVEILATSLLDRKKYPTKEFKKLYYKRWRIETFFQTIKSRLAVDNFTGKTAEAVRQDFYATLFVSGLETILSNKVNLELSQKNTVHKQQVNKAVSFHAIKDRIILLMFDPPQDFEERVRELFLLNPSLQRPRRIKEKERISLKTNFRSLHFQKFARKCVF